MVNLKNLIAGFASVAIVAAAFGAVLPTATTHAQLDDAEYIAAHGWALDNGLTTMPTPETFNPWGALTREQFAKFAAATSATSFCIEADASASCDFSDLPADPTLDEYVELACQMGLVKGSGGMYYPTDVVSKAAVLTVISRMTAAANGVDAPSEDSTPRWANHFNAMVAAGVTTETDVYAVDRDVTRYEVLLMLYRASMNSDAVCDEDVDLSDLLADLFGDDEEVEEETEEEGENENTTVTASDGQVVANLSPSTAVGDTVPGLASVEVGTFDFTADGDDVMLQTIVLERFGLGSEDVVDEVTLVLDGGVVSKSRSFNSDEEATLSLNPEILVEAGETVSITVLATVGDSTTVSNEEFAIGLTDFETNGDEDDSNLPVIANEFEVAGTNAAQITVSEDGNLSDVELGEDGAEIGSFEIENDSDDAVYITTLTLEDDQNEIEDSFENFVLEHEGNEVAMVASVNDKYLTFELETPVMIDENETEDFKVLADVIAGAGEQVNLIIDESIYVRGYDDRYGYGLAVVANYTPTAIDINAGELTFVEMDLDPDQLRADREDFVIAAFDVNVNAGQDLSLEDISFGVSTTAGGLTVDLFEHFDEVQLIVTIDGTRRTYDLDESGLTAGIDTSFTIGETDLGIFLPDGADIMVALEVDSISIFPVAGTIGEEFNVTLDVVNDVEIIENDDDEQVTDIVPSSMAFDDIEFVDSTVEINSINMTDVDVVKGAENVDVVKFEIETDDVSGVFVEGFSFDGNIDIDENIEMNGFNNDGNVTQDYITALRLWVKTDSGYELLEDEGGFDINNGEVTLDDFDEVFIPASSSMEFLLTVDIADSDTIANDAVSFTLLASDIEDDDNTQLCALSGTPVCATADSTRQAVITDSGTLNVSVDTDEDEVNDETYVLGGSSSSEAPYVAAFEFTAENEAVEIEDLTINVTVNGAGTFDEAVSEIVLFDEDGNVIDTETVSSASVDFNDVNLVIEEGSQLVFVKVVTDVIGDNENGAVAFDVTFNVEVDNVDGADSGDEVSGASLTYEGVVAANTNESLEFSVVPVKFSDAEFVTSAEGSSVDTSTTDGNDINIAILKLTADSWDNTDRNDGSELEANVNTLRFNTSNSTDVSNYEIIRIGNGSTSYMPGTILAGSGTVEFDLGTGSNTIEFDSGDTGYFLIRADIDAGGSNTTVKLTLADLNGGAAAGFEPIEYAPSDDAAEVYTELRIGEEFVESQNVTVSNN